MTYSIDTQDIFECSHCERDADISTRTDLSNGDAVCGSCSDEFIKCQHCDSDTHTDDTHTAERNLVICDDCASRFYTYSSRENCYVCDDAAVRLQDSGDTVSLSWAESNAYSDEDGDWYSDPDNIPSSDATIHEYQEDVLFYCDFDREALRRGTLMFGVELEMEPVADGQRDQVVDALGGRTCDKYILKDDASLDSGVELVTVPLTLDGHRTDFDWPNVLKPLTGIAKSGAGTTNCGMHVHINKAALSPLQIGKILVFLNSLTMRHRITEIAQRSSNSYCERADKRITDGSKYSANRHDIANVGSHTVEIRMFRGNLRADRVLKNVEFCHALVMYCRDASLQTIEKWPEFASWLLARRSQYTNLIKFLAEGEVPCFEGVVRRRKDQSREMLQCA